jgi:hypothetical protein
MPGWPGLAWVRQKLHLGLVLALSLNPVRVSWVRGLTGFGQLGWVRLG